MPSRSTTVTGAASISIPQVSQRSTIVDSPYPLLIPAEGKEVSASQADNLDDEELNVSAMSEEQVKLQLSASVKRFFELRGLDKGETYLRKLPSEHRWRLVNKLVSFAAVSGVADARLVGDLFSRVASVRLCSSEDFDAGFSPTMEILDVIALHSPNAVSLVAIMLKGTQLSGGHLDRLVCKAMGNDSEILLALLL